MQERELRTHIKKGIRDAHIQREFLKGSIKSLDILCEEVSLLEAVEFEANKLRPSHGKPVFQILDQPSDPTQHTFAIQQPLNYNRNAPAYPSHPHQEKGKSHPGIFCNYCKKEGHIVAECRKRMMYQLQWSIPYRRHM